MTASECFRIYKRKPSNKTKDPKFGQITVSDVIFGTVQANRKQMELEAALTAQDTQQGWYYVTEKIDCPKSSRQGGLKPSPSKLPRH